LFPYRRANFNSYSLTIIFKRAGEVRGETLVSSFSIQRKNVFEKAGRKGFPHHCFPNSKQHEDRSLLEERRNCLGLRPETQ
jgi:hypothetical protein